MMRAVRLHAPGGPAGIVVEDIEKPSPGPGEVLVRVHAAAITRDELDWVADRLPAIPSYEFSGTVDSVGAGVQAPQPGEAVYAMAVFDRGGAAAEFVVIPSELVAPKPRTLDHVNGAAVPLAGLSAWQGLFDHGRLESGQRVLIVGAAGGVGSFAVQLARIRGVHVIGVTSARNREFVRDLGADEVVDYGESVAPVDLLFDTSGGDRLERSLPALRNGGRLVTVAAEVPREWVEAKEVDPVYFVVEPNRQQLIDLAGLIDGGELRPQIDAVFALADARAAFEHTLSGGGRGKTVLSVVA